MSNKCLSPIGPQPGDQCRRHHRLWSDRTRSRRASRCTRDGRCRHLGDRGTRASVRRPDFASAGDTVDVDIARPRDVPTDATAHEGVVVHDLDALEAVTARIGCGWWEAVASVEEIFDNELARLRTGLKRERVDIVIAAMYDSAERTKTGSDARPPVARPRYRGRGGPGGDGRCHCLSPAGDTNPEPPRRRGAGRLGDHTNRATAVRPSLDRW